MLRFLLIPLCLMACTHPVLAENTAFHKVEVLLMDGEQGQPKKFIADGKHISVIFQSHSDANAVDVFPEPPIAINDKIKNTSCKIVEGGVWSREEVYFSSDEDYILMGEHSGSGRDLVSYDTSTCLKVKRVDMSGMRWHVEGDKARTVENCSSADIKDCKKFRHMDLSVFLK